MNSSASEVGQAKEAFETVYELSRLLNTGLDRESLGIIVSLIEKGVNPEALAAAVKEMRRTTSNKTLGGQKGQDKQFQY
ncbi:hypothetical protein SDRG_01168 [Saprolegnia diclina VS20]|uniref:Mitotic-spindle organizing protein 1 n=1 Tax=Saprolegnia diclina (strain VS20) TaxID=1156394 RepID=T0SE72_SAPDV|nr:hypothetical protein SDRG_01168 [Saprolegnia diclina VS20]EQC41192.1 hypothetical protein SDRG_01168 [Saprolegnia diclina VS20]|eukprot:XP_008604906.1 hypothetical protein SDRG_01168 [Saprolegnia diclina VS20]